MGDLIISQSINEKSVLQLWKNAYRTKGLPQRNVIPQPAIEKFLSVVVPIYWIWILRSLIPMIPCNCWNLGLCGECTGGPQAWTDGTEARLARRSQPTKSTEFT